MKTLLINVDDNSSAKLFLDLAKKLHFDARIVEENTSENLLDWEEIPDEVKASIERGLAQSEAGQTVPHKEVMKRYKKWLKE